jgi:hypothetical protein
VGKKKIVKSNNTDVPSEESVVEATATTDLPATPSKLLDGYKVTKVKNKKKESKIKITLPKKNGKKSKDIIMGTEDSLMIINGDPKYVVSTPQDVVSAIRKYALGKGMRHFVVDDITQNKQIGTKGDVMINDNHLMFLTIKKHNKAA